MKALGIDAEDIARFANWQSYSQSALLKIFTLKEIQYCMAVPVKSAERFAARWAIKEACYKALCPFFNEKIPFTHFCRQIECYTDQQPILTLNWARLAVKDTIKTSHINFSLTHTDHTAIALVVFI